MKKRNKKYKPKKPPVRLWSWESDRSTEKRYVNAQQKIGFIWTDINTARYDDSIVKPRNWTLIVRAIMWYPDGNVDIVPAITHRRNVNLRTLEEEAKALRKEVIRTAKREHIVDIGWVALSYENTPRADNDQDLIDLGAITEERQMLWNLAWREEVKDIVK